ncbi:MAG: RHS repeat-associated protein [Cellvibrionaceae bacterium]
MDDESELTRQPFFITVHPAEDDSDGDGISDIVHVFPLNANKYSDLYGEQVDVSQGIMGNQRFTTKGYTAHEHIEGMDIIHMGGRIYDPLIGRMLQTDIVIQAPQKILSYNRYAYVSNNQMNRIDSTGCTSEDGKGSGGNDGSDNDESTNDPTENEKDENVKGKDQEKGNTKDDTTKDVDLDSVGPKEEQQEEEYGLLNFVVDVVGWGLIAFDIIDTPISPGPDVGIAGAAMLGAKKAVKKKAKGAAKNREENIAKGIPAKELGPSGKPKIKVRKHANKKSAKDAAQSRSKKGAQPENHPNPTKGEDPHFHPEGKKHREHHSYPK